MMNTIYLEGLHDRFGVGGRDLKVRIELGDAGIRQPREQDEMQTEQRYQNEKRFG